MVYMHRYLFLLPTIFFAINLAAAPAFSSKDAGSIVVQNSQDHLFLLRINEILSDKEIPLAKWEIEQYLEAKKGKIDPQVQDYLLGLLGDINMQAQDFDKACQLYEKIKDPLLQKEIFLSYLTCLYNLEKYDTLYYRTMAFLEAEPNIEAPSYLQVNFLLAESLLQKAKKEQNVKEKKQLAVRSKEIYELLLGSKYNLEAMQALTSVYVLTEDYPLAINTYNLLMEKMPEKKSALLFERGVLEITLNPQKAMETFLLVYQEGREKSQEAYFNRLLLLYEAKQYNQIILERDQISSVAATFPMAHYMLGCSYLTEGDFEKGKQELNAFLAFKEKFPIEAKAAFASLTQCAYKLKDPALLEICLEEMKKEKNDPSYFTQVYFALALLYAEKQDFAKATDIFSLLEKNYPDFAKTEDFLFELAKFTYEKKDFDKSAKLFCVLVDDGVQKEKRSSYWGYLLNSMVAKVNNSQDKNRVKNQFIEILKIAKESSDFTLDEEKKQNLLNLATLYCDVGRYEEGLNELLSLMRAYPAFEGHGKALYLMAICHKYGKKNLEGFCQLAKKAIEVNTYLEDVGEIHIELFNAYLELAKEKKEMLSQGADHLYAAFMLKKEIGVSNLLWLSEHYYHLGQNGAEKVVSILEKVITDHMPDGQFSEKTLFLEQYVLHLAECYGLANQKQKEQSLLESVNKQQSMGSLSFKEKEKTAFLLGSLYLEQKENGKAQNCFSFIENAGEKNPYYPMACLQKEKLVLRSFESAEMTMENPKLLLSLSKLKTLAVHKNLLTEPAHLEASLEYVDWVCQLTPVSERAKKRLFLLERIYNYFKSEEDIISKDYQKARLLHRSQNALYEGYMQYMQAQLAAVSYLADRNQIKNKEGFLKAKEALLSLSQNQTHPFLQKRLEATFQFLAQEQDNLKEESICQMK